MKNQCLLLLLILTIGSAATLNAQTKKTIQVASFDKVIVSPHIQVTFKQASSERIVVEHSTVPVSKINARVKGKTLRIYLEDAKVLAKNEKVKHETWRGKRSIYYKDTVRIIVNYKSLRGLSLRSEEEFTCEDLLDMEKFKLNVYGEAAVFLNHVQIKKLKATLYGESSIHLLKGNIGKQKIIAYGESEIHSEKVQSKRTKLLTYGEGDFSLNVSEHLKVSGFGESAIAYSNDAKVRRGILIGGTTIEAIQ